jgi:membrane-associated phospholipid phosphatase
VRLGLAAGAASVAAASGCALVAAGLRLGPVAAADGAVLDALHRLMLRSPGLVQAFGLLSVLLHPVVMRVAAGVAAIVLLWRGRGRHAAWLLTATLLGALLDPLLKEVFARARPAVPNPVASAPGYALPSGHALAASLLAGCLLLLAPVLTGRPAGSRPSRAQVAAALTLSALTGLDRVALGVHFTTDVLAGYLVAAAVVGTLWWLAPPSPRPPAGPAGAPL